MFFRDGRRSNLSGKSISEVFLSARDTDNFAKTQRKLDYNSLQNVRPCNSEIGDDVLVRNYKNIKQVWPFLPLNSKLLIYIAKGNVVLVKDPNSGVYLKRHPNDLKRLNKDITFDVEKN